MLKFSEYMLLQELLHIDLEDIEEGVVHNFIRRLKKQPPEKLPKFIATLQNPETIINLLTRKSKHSNPIVKKINSNPEQNISVVKAIHADSGKGFNPVKI